MKNSATIATTTLRPRVEPFVPDAEIAITASEKRVQILPGALTHVWSYEGRLLSGSGASVQAMPGSYLGPILRVESGTRLRIFFHSHLAEKTVLHPHGLRVPEGSDGQPTQVISPGETKLYEFQVIDRASPCWFHPHARTRTGYQVMMGLAGLFYVWDQEEELAVPGASTGAHDVPVVVQDRTFDRNNQFVYQPHPMCGYLGDRILVNGKPNPALALEPRSYRFRILNGSNARTYKLAWSNSMALKVIGTEGGLLPAVAVRSYVMLMPGERLDLWADFGQLAGRQIILRSLAFDGGCGSMGSGGMGSGLANGAAFNILTVNVGRTTSANPALGLLPALAAGYNESNVPNYAAPRPLVLGMQHGTWTINGRVYEGTMVAGDELVCRGETMAWEWVNNTPIPLSMHIHNVRFRVVGRTPASTTSSYGTVDQGFVDTGWKDTVLVWPGERVKIAMTFGPDIGRYVYQCQIFEHEDLGMIRHYAILDV